MTRHLWVSTEADLPWNQLGRLLAGELTAAEEAHFRAWLAADPSREQLVAELRAVWTATAPGWPKRDPEQVLAALRRQDTAPVRELAPHRRVTGESAVPITPIAASARRRGRRALLAAGLIGMALGGGWLVRAGSRSGEQMGAGAGVTRTEHRTARGQQLRLTLLDGSTVLLAPESRLRYDAAYGATSRIVEVMGEAAFDVVHDDQRPFVVRAGSALVHDLGTRFVVRARADEGTVAVAVTEGRVALRGAAQPRSAAVRLAVNEMGRVDTAGHAIRWRDGRLQRYVGWTEGRLVFEATPLAEVAAELSRWYDVDVRLEGAGLGEQQLTAEFQGQSLAAVVEMIRASLGLHLRAGGQQYVLSVP